MKILISILVTTFVSSCSLFSNKENRNYEYMASKGTLDLESTILQYLTIQNTMAGGNYVISLTPLSKHLLFARAKRVAQMTGLEVQKINAEYLKKYSLDKSCFELKFNIVETDKVNDLSKWKFFMIDQNEVSHNMSAVSNDSIVQTRIGRGFRQIPQWLGSGVICSKRNISFKYGFSVKIKVNFVPWPFSDILGLTWLVNYPDPKDASSYKQKKIQRYRGW